jgi:hypothetical protein
MNEVRPDMTTAVKLASLVAHLDEYDSPDGRGVDLDAAMVLVKDWDVQRWLKSIDPVLLPARREA